MEVFVGDVYSNSPRYAGARHPPPYEISHFVVCMACVRLCAQQKNTYHYTVQEYVTAYKCHDTQTLFTMSTTNTSSQKSSVQEASSPFSYVYHLLGYLEENMRDENIPDKDDPELKQWLIQQGDIEMQLRNEISRALMECVATKWYPIQG